MKCTIPEISWHNREPVLTVDIHPVSDNIYKLASGGGDSHVLIWQMVLCENGSVKQEVISDLTRHQKSVNTVRWSSTGQYLASADDDANIIVWQLKTDNIPLLEGDTQDKEVWVVYKVLRGHKEDIYDLCWSTDNLKLLSGSVDNTAIIWDLTKGKLDHILTDHKGFVQGVAWDPKDQLLATISTDRMCRIFDKTGRHVKVRIHKGKLPVPSEHILYGKESKYFHDDTFKSFFRRLQFTPDGSLLIVPSGYFQDDDGKILNSTLVFTMDNWTEPAAVLPLEKQSSTVVRCCPLLFQHREDGPEPVVKLPYRMIFAVGTDHDIVLYDTQQPKPFARFHEIHYTRITDLTWSRDGLLLVASSTDGFCSLITFDPNELGVEYVKEESDEENNVLDVSETIETSEKDENIDISNKTVKEKEELKKRPNFIVQWAQNTPKKAKIEKDNNGVVEIVDDEDKPKLTPKKDEENKTKPEKINLLTPRRITPKKVEESKLKQSKTEETPKKEINLLTPRRITPKEVEESKNNKEIKMEENKISSNTNSTFIEHENKDKLGELPKEIKEINKLKPRRITPQKIGECSKNNALAKPIEVRRKPRIFEAFKENSVNKSTVTSKELQIKLIPVDKTLIYKKERRQTDNEEKPSKHNTKDDLNRIEDVVVIDDTEEEEEEADLSHEKTSKTSNNEEAAEKKVTKKNRRRAETDSSNSKVTKKTEKSKQNNSKAKKDTPEGTNYFDLKSSPTNNPSKKKEHPRKKLNTTPVKSNSLLDFLKRSGEKSKKNELERKVQSNICEEEEARDGFNNKTTQNKNCASSSPDAAPLQEDLTEDFCLQLEDTQDEEKKNVSSERMDVDEAIKEDNDARVIDISDDSCSPVKKTEESLVLKKPRRVTLITLSSPKGKKKPVIEETVKE